MKTPLFVGLLCLFSALKISAQTGELALLYKPSTGNLSVKNISGHPVSLQAVSVLTLGKGDAAEAGGFGPLMPSGIPGVQPGQGALNKDQAKLPITEHQTSNYSNSGLNGIYSEILLLNTDNPFVILPTNGILDLGNVTQPGWTQAIINQIFITNPDISPNEGLNYGNFLYQSTAGFTLAPVLVDLTTDNNEFEVNPLQIIYQKSYNSVFIMSENESPVSYSIYSFAGQIVSEGLLTGQRIDMSRVVNGPYLVKVEQNGKVVTQKIIKD